MTKIYYNSERFKSLLELKNKTGVIVYDPNKEAISMYIAKSKKRLLYCDVTGITMKEVLRYMDFLCRIGFYVKGKYSPEGVFMGFKAKYNPNPNLNEKPLYIDYER